MTSGAPDPTVDERLDRFIAAWHGGEAPNAAVFVTDAPAEQRDELAELIAAFLELAPSVEPTADAVGRLADDPLVARLTALESARWDGSAPWGLRLQRLREASGFSPQHLAALFGGCFGLSRADVERAPAVFEQLEAGALPSSGVAARAARMLEQLLGADPGALTTSADAQLGGALLRSHLPEDAHERDRLGELLRQVDDALPSASGDAPSETLSDLLGA